MSRICFAPSGRRTCVGGRLPRAALGGCAASLCPGLNCFAPSGHGRFLDAWPVSSGHGRSDWGKAILRGWAATLAPGPRDPIVLTPRRGNDKLAQGRASWRSRDAPPWVTMPPKIHRPEGARQDREPDVLTIFAKRMEMDGLDSRPAAVETNGNESVVFRVIPAFKSFRRTIYRVCGPFVAHLFCPFRATACGGGPFTQGGARRLRRLALPWAKLFCPFGAWRFLDAWPVSSRHGRSDWGMAILRSWAATSAPGRRDPIVLTPRRGTTRPRTGRANDLCEPDGNGSPRFAARGGRNE